MNETGKLSQGKYVFLLAMVSCFLWGSATPAIKIGYQMFSIVSTDTASIILFAGMRFFLAGMLVVLFQSLLRRRFLAPQKEALPSIFALSLAQTAVQYLFFYIGLAHTSGVHGTIISGTGGFISILMASLLFHYEKLTPAKLLGCIAGFAGILIMNLSPQDTGSLFDVSFLGEGFVFFSQISYAVSGILIKKFSSRFDVVMLSGWQFTLGGLLMIAAGLIGGGHIAFTDNWQAYLLLLYMALISAVAYSVWGTASPTQSHQPGEHLHLFDPLIRRIAFGGIFRGMGTGCLPENSGGADTGMRRHLCRKPQAISDFLLPKGVNP